MEVSGWLRSMISEEVYPTGLKLRFGEQGDAYFCFLLEGAFSEGTVSYLPGEVIFFPAGRHHMVEIVERSRCLVIRVGPDLLRRVRTSGGELRGATSLGAGEAIWLAQRLYAEFQERGPARALKMDAIVLQLLALATRSHQGKGPGQESFWLKRVRQVIDNHYLDEYRLSDLAALAGVHRVHLASAFRKQYGTTIGQHLRKLRMDHASRLLAETNLPLHQIAVLCRFADHSHFTKRFKKQCGVTPAEYRNLYQAVGIPSHPPVNDKKQNAVAAYSGPGLL
jgi:AraC family transcriptional regulator